MKIEKIQYGSFRHETYVRYLPDDCTGVETVIYCHGGAFRYGSCEHNRAFLEELALKSSMPVYSVGFRNIDDARMLYAMVADITSSINAIVRETRCSTVHLVGDSSGAYLALVTLLNALNHDHFGPRAIFNVKSVTLICGYLDFRENDSITSYFVQYPAFQYLPNELRKVLEADYSNIDLPHLQLITGDMDPCREDMESLCERITSTRPSADLEVIFAESTEEDAADHCFPIYKPNSTIGERAVCEMASFINSHAIRIVPFDEVSDAQLVNYYMSSSVKVGMQFNQSGSCSMSCSLREYFKTRNDDLWCLTDSEEIIGVLGMRVLSTDTAELHTFMLVRNYRGGSLDELLINKAISSSREAGFGKLVINMDNHDIESIKVYTSSGFKYVGKQEYFPYAGDMMELDL